MPVIQIAKITASFGQIFFIFGGLSDTFAGIDPSHAPHFIAAQIIGTLLALAPVRRLYD